MSRSTLEYEPRAVAERGFDPAGFVTLYLRVLAFLSIAAMVITIPFTLVAAVPVVVLLSRRTRLQFGTDAARRELSDVLREAITWLARPDNDFSWSSWEDSAEAVEELSKIIETIESGGAIDRRLGLLFAPTGPVQEVSVSSGWGDDFLSLAARFDVVAARLSASETQQA